MAYKRWTAAEIARLEALVALGWKRREILAQFPGMTTRRLAGKMYDIGLRTARDPDPFSRTFRLKTGLRMGSLARSLSQPVRQALADVAVKRQITVAEAVDVMLREWIKNHFARP